jgi:8-oxo-dGTP diphosphatase
VYEHAHVRLHFFISRAWRGEPQSLEGQAFAWQGTVGVAPLLPATIPLLEWLDLVRYPTYPSAAASANATATPPGPASAAL